jgi:hypothetical protein
MGRPEVVSILRAFSENMQQKRFGIKPRSFRMRASSERVFTLGNQSTNL